MFGWLLMWFPEKIKLSCKVCGRKGLWIEAFIIGDEEAIPVLVCDSHLGCGSVMQFSEYGLMTDGLI